MATEMNQTEMKCLGESHTGNLWQSQEFPESQPAGFNYCFSNSSSVVFKVEVKLILSIHLSIYTHWEKLCRPFSKEHLYVGKEYKGQEKGLISCTPHTCQKLKHRASNDICSRPHRKFAAKTRNLIYIPESQSCVFNIFPSQFIFHVICSLYCMALERYGYFLLSFPLWNNVIQEHFHWTFEPLMFK